MRYRGLRKPLLIILFLLLIWAPAFASDRIQRTVAALEAFVPAAFLLFQGADTGFELGVIGASLVLQSVPNAVMLIGESGEYPELTRISRWVNFGIDSAVAGGLLGVGVAYLAGAFGPEADVRARGGIYLALSVPAGIAAFSDFLPYSIEQRISAREDSPAEPATNPEL